MIRNDCESILLIKCPYNHGNEKSCSKVFKNKHELKRHVQSVHELLICEICLEHKKCFSTELQLFTAQSLSRHEKETSVNRSGVGSSGHAQCTVCSKYFYSEDELYEHCRDNHELCHICQRAGRHGRYFRDYHRLEEHFGKEHFLCPEPLCKELKFIVFENELEYKAHQVEMHLSHQKQLQRSQQRQLQRLNISFTGPDRAGSDGNRTQGQTNNTSTTSPQSQQPGNRLTQIQKDQIGSNLVFGEVTDELSNHLQSLSLYQQRNDTFMDSLRSHLNPVQVQSILKEARAFQKGEIQGYDIIGRLEKVLNSNEILSIFPDLSELQLDALKRDRLTVAVSEYEKKCRSFPALGSKVITKNAMNTFKNNTNTTANANTKIIPATSVTPASNNTSTRSYSDASVINTSTGSGTEQFPKLPTATSSLPPGFQKNQSSIMSSFASSTSFKVLQINPSGTPGMRTASSDPSKNPGLLLSQLAGGPGPKKVVQTAKKPASFSSAAVGNATSTLSKGTSIQETLRNQQLDPKEFPQLGKNIMNNNFTPDNVDETTNSTAFASNAFTQNAFFAPSDRDTVDSFTLGPEDEKQTILSAPSTTKTKGKAKGKVVFKSGQSWNI